MPALRVLGGDGPVRKVGPDRLFDGTGLRRILVDVSSPPLSRRLIAEVLAPLDAQGAGPARRSIETLAAYLDAQSSPTRAARTLTCTRTP